jgi:hypothetical protein
MSDITVNLPDNLGSVRFPAGTSPDVIEREAANAYLKAKGTKAGKADAKTDGAAQAFGGGVLQGAGDEVTAAVRSAFPAFSNWMMGKSDFETKYAPNQNKAAQTVSDAPTADQRYEEELARERAKATQYRKDNPVTATSLNIAGAVAPTVVATMMGVPMAPSMNGGMLANGAKAAATGAAYGAVNGFNEGEGGFEDRLKQGGIGAGMGAGLGVAGSLASRGAGAVYDWGKTTTLGQGVLKGADKVADFFERLGMVPNKSLSAAAPEGSMISGDNAATYAADQIRAAIPGAGDAVKQRAAQYIATAVERGSMTTEQAAQELAKLGEGGLLADVSKSLFRLGRMTNTMQGKTNDLAEQVLEGRAKTYAPTMRSTIEGPNGKSIPEDVYFRGEFPAEGGNIFDQLARAVGKRGYQDEMTAAGLKQTPEMLKLMANPQIEGAVDRVLKSLSAARVGTDRAPESMVEAMHMVKREIQNIGLDANGRPSSTAYQWQQTANDFVSALKKANPKLAEADVAYAKAKGLPEAYDVGLGAWRKGSTAAGEIDRTAAAVENMMGSADVMKRNAAEFGAVNAGRARTGGTEADAIAFARDISQSDEVRRKVAALFPDRAQQIFDRAEAILRFNKTKAGTLGGSQTADKAAEVMLGGVPLGNAGVRVTPGGMTPRLFESARDLVSKVTAPNEITRDQIGRMMFNLDPTKNAETLDLVRRVLQERAAQRQGGAVWGGMAGGYGSEAAR